MKFDPLFVNGCGSSCNQQDGPHHSGLSGEIVIAFDK